VICDTENFFRKRVSEDVLAPYSGILDPYSYALNMKALRFSETYT
jgi:hypothetical protein